MCFMANNCLKLFPIQLCFRSRNQAKITGVTIRMCSKRESMPPITGITSELARVDLRPD